MSGLTRVCIVSVEAMAGYLRFSLELFLVSTIRKPERSFNWLTS